MRNRKSILDYYRALGLQPGASTREVRRAYLQLVKQWHPDRFQQNARKQFLAQEKLKEINEAYSFLKDYRPGQAWPGDPDEYWQQRPYPSGATAQWREYQRRASYRPPAADPYEGNYQYRPVRESRPGMYAGIWIAIVVVGNLLQSFIGGTHNAPKVARAEVSQPASSNMSTVVEVPGNGPADPVSQELASARSHLPYFFVGSSKADVRQIQGVPDWSNEREWRYGTSSVYFVGQMVERWVNKASSPLKAVILPRAEPTSVFAVGSSAVDVLAIQGRPTLVSDGDLAASAARDPDRGSWRYGQSEIQFYKGRVTSWSEAPGSPLRVSK